MTIARLHALAYLSVMKSFIVACGLLLCVACSTDSKSGAGGSGGGAQAGGSNDAADAGAAAPFPTEITMTEIAVGDFIFDARVAGREQGEVVLLLHGFPETSYEWRQQLPALAEAGYRAVAPDQRGYSSRARPTAVSEYDIRNLAQDVVDIADAIGADQFHLVGHDWGASVAWLVATLFTDRVLSLNPISVGHPDAVSPLRADPASCQYAASSYIDFFITPEATDSFVANDFASLRGLYSGFSPEDAEAYLQTLGSREAIDAALNWYRARFTDGRVTIFEPSGPVDVPTMFTWSDGDTALCRDGAEATGNFVTGPYRFEVLSGVDHWLPEKAPIEYNALLLDHLHAFPAAP